MISNLDRQCIDNVISSAISTVCFYGLEHPEHNAALRQHLLRLANSTDPIGINAEIPVDLPEHIKLAFRDIKAYLYSSYPSGDFFLLGELSPSLNEIQIYIRNMLHSISFYLDDNSNSKAPDAYKNIDSSVKQILRPDNTQAKKNIRWQDALLHAHNALNEEQNITVYRQITRPVNHLLIIKNHSQNKANDPIRIALDQRLFLLELLKDIKPNLYQSTGPGTRRYDADGILNNPQNIEAVANIAAVENVAMPAQETPVVYFVLWNLASFAALSIVGAIIHYSNQPTPQPQWPAGMTHLANSTADLDQMGAHMQYTDMNNIVFPFTQHEHHHYPLLTISSVNIQIARNYANHENLDHALEKMLDRTHVDLLRKDTKFMEIYVTLWAFFAEHGRNMTHQAAAGVPIYLTPQQAIHLRALEALRVGLEELLKEKYPEYHARLSCNNHQNPMEQIGALNDLIKLEFESQHNLFRERITLFDGWLAIVEKYEIDYPSFLRTPSFHIDKIKYNRTPNLVMNAMQAVMEDNTCPWWQATFRYFKKTAGDLQKTVCTAWQNTKPVLQKNRYHRNYDNYDFPRREPQ